MAKSLEEYKSVPIRGVDIFKTFKFITGDEPYQTILVPGLLPEKASVSEMVTKCTSATNQIIEKFNKYKELGYVRSDTQAMALGSLVADSETAENFYIANIWRRQPNAEKSGRLTKTKFVEILDKWFTYDKHRIGWSGTTTEKVLIRDPKSGKPIEYSLSDRYNKPINECLYPPLANHKSLGRIRISVGQAESIATGIADRFINDNDIINFSASYPEEYDAYIVILTLSGFSTESSQTLAGAKMRGLQAYAALKNLPEERKRREQLRLAEIKTEEQALKAIAEREVEKEENERKGQEAQEKLREAIDLAEVVKQQQENPYPGTATKKTN